MLNLVFTANQSLSRDRFSITATALQCGGMKRILPAVLLAVLISALSVFAAAPGPALAQDRWLDLPAPTGVSAVNGANAGEAVISWNPVAGAAFYRIAWIAAADAAALTENGGDWLEAVAYVNIAAADSDADAVRQRTLTRLNPGVRYTFLVGSLSYKSGTPSWSAPAELNLTLGTLAYDEFIEITVPVGLTFNEPGAFGGYTLFAAPLNRNSYLVDQDGRMVRQWDTPALAHTRLLENGNVLGSIS